MSQAGRPVDRKEIRALLWGESTFVDYDVGMDYCVYRIRSVLGDNAQAPRYVETLPGRGYRFIAPVTRERPFAEPTLAVLPFANLNRDPGKDYFADGVTDALITELAAHPGGAGHLTPVRAPSEREPAGRSTRSPATSAWTAWWKERCCTRAVAPA